MEEIAASNIWPLATYTKEPADRAEGWLMWANLATLAFTSIIIPTFIPNVYTPVDPKRPAKQPHPEQTASIASLRTFSYLTFIIDAAQKVAHLPASELPPIADYDRAQDLMVHAKPYLSPTSVRKGRHIFFGLIGCYTFEYFKALVAMTFFPIAGFLTPLALNRLLTILESGGKVNTGVKPWFWILMIFFARILNSLSFQYYIVAMARVLTTSESILTQLLFDYSLRVRIKAETSEKEQGGDASASEGRGESKKTTSSFNGRLANLITVDLKNITEARDLLFLFWDTPLEIVGCAVFLYFILGWSAFVGIGLIIILLPVPGWLTSVASRVQDERMKKASTDNRTQTVTESMNVLRMIKMFGWERKIQSRIDERREEELKWLWKARIVNLLMTLVNQVIPSMTMLVTYGTAALVAKIELTSAKVFSSMLLFNNIRMIMMNVNFDLQYFIRGRTSINRLNDFFKQTELLDVYDEDSQATHPASALADEGVIGFRNATFTWDGEPSNSGTETPSRFRLVIPGEIQFAKGKINLIVGPTGSGKTSLLMALLGEMHFSPTHPDSAYNLPRDGGIAFAVQESWVLNQTIRENVLFNSPYDEERYKKVLHQCALEQDLKLFEAGDQTEVGERGLTLSGGQKARLTLARAIYSKAEIVLLDDVLAALDVHTAKWIVNKCFKGDLVQGRTILLVTHNIALTRSLADLIVSVSADNVATSHGQDLWEVLASEPALQAEFKHDEEAIKADEEVIDPESEKKKDKQADGKLILAEEIQEGNVGWKSIAFFLKALGGNHVTLFFVLWMGAGILEFVTRSFSIWFMGYWSRQYELHPIEDVPVLRYMGIYALITLFVIVVFSARDIWLLLGQLRASRTIHKVLSESILGTTLRWLDETPVSRIIQRMTLDIGSVDDTLTRMFGYLQTSSLSMTVALISAVLFVPVFALPGLFIAAFGVYMGSKYLRAQLSIRREMSNSKAPMLAHFNAAAAGLLSLRAYGAQDAYRMELQKRLDNYVRIARTNYDVNRWINTRIDFLGALFTTSLAAYMTYGSTVTAANVGFSLNRASDFCAMVLLVVRIYNEFQAESNSLERIVAYTEVEQEPKPTELGRPPAAWPTNGDLRVENLTARYSKTGPAVLHGLTFSVAAGERIGIVGRTGSGKSSLTLALLRCVITEGDVYFDGLKTSDINLDALRSNITIIPQIPELLSGTLRYNLDPFDEYDDATLNSALKASGLYATQSDSGEGRLTLDTDIASGGSNVSVGQRQIIALARAIIRSSKLLILDEATSAIDHETDSIIQNTLRRELGTDVTVLTVAHRLQSIIDADKILVLDAGRIVEFAPPAELLSEPKGFFKSLCDESGDKEQLYQLAMR
ncbi:hypothetical protein NMY22_g13302 [Coprinellus aureogranulatus]|nr:hypothetical protein NMY22_g13302 [Coprinellus aureogranulatus]